MYNKTLNMVSFSVKQMHVFIPVKSKMYMKMLKIKQILLSNKIIMLYVCK